MKTKQNNKQAKKQFHVRLKDFNLNWNLYWNLWSDSLTTKDIRKIHKWTLKTSINIKNGLLNSKKKNKFYFYSVDNKNWKENYSITIYDIFDFNLKIKKESNLFITKKETEEKFSINTNAFEHFEKFNVHKNNRLVNYLKTMLKCYRTSSGKKRLEAAQTIDKITEKIQNEFILQLNFFNNATITFSLIKK